MLIIGSPRGLVKAFLCLRYNGISHPLHNIGRIHRRAIHEARPGTAWAWDWKVRQ